MSQLARVPGRVIYPIDNWNDLCNFLAAAELQLSDDLVNELERLRRAPGSRLS